MASKFGISGVSLADRLMDESLKTARALGMTEAITEG